MKKLGRRQGDLYRHSSPSPINPIRTKILTTMDGTKTCISASHGESYHPKYGAAQYTNKTFIQQIPKYVWEQSNLNLLDIGFGLGYNSFLFMDECKEHNIKAEITALEHHYLHSSAFVGQHSKPLHNKILHDLIIHHHSDVDPQTHLKIHWGDARLQSHQCKPNSYDLIFLDPFHEKNNSELVTLDFLNWMKQFLKIDGVLIFSRFHTSILHALLQAGFKLTKHSSLSPPIACLPENSLESISDEEINHILCHPKGIPFRDPNLCLPHRDIVRKRDILHRK
jgi:tRNA U34 5-methylaminomethyl-2-thiouridine-forming methyltransferase MnmC